VLARLGAGEHIIGRAENFGGASRRGAQRAEWFDERHGELRGTGMTVLIAGSASTGKRAALISPAGWRTSRA